MKLWTERESETSQQTRSESRNNGAAEAAASSDSQEIAAPSSNTSEQDQMQRVGAPGMSGSTTRIYDEAASLLAHNRAVLGQALARAGHTDRGIAELEVACPEILEYQQNAQGRRDGKSEHQFFGSVLVPVSVFQCSVQQYVRIPLLVLVLNFFTFEIFQIRSALRFG